jgi:hypothetical protein
MDRDDKVGKVSDFGARAAATARAAKKSALPASLADPEVAPPQLSAEENEALQRQKRLERSIGMGWLGVGETALLSADTANLRSLSPSAQARQNYLHQEVWRHAPARSYPRPDPWEDEAFTGRIDRRRPTFAKKAGHSQEQLAMIKPFVGYALSLTDDDLSLLRAQTLRTDNLEKHPLRPKPRPPAGTGPRKVNDSATLASYRAADKDYRKSTRQKNDGTGSQGVGSTPIGNIRFSVEPGSARSSLASNYDDVGTGSVSQRATLSFDNPGASEELADIPEDY